jgi:hypothetical protein
VKAEDKKLQKGGGNQKFFTTLIWRFYLSSIFFPQSQPYRPREA